MPALRPPEAADYRELPPRKALRGGKADVLIVGGGPAGLGAALGARRAGAQVILAEHYGFLGGNATAALVMPLMSFHTQQPVPEQTGNTTLLPQDHGPGHSVIAGVLRDFLDKLISAGGACAPSCARPRRRPSARRRARARPASSGAGGPCRRGRSCRP